MSHFVIFSILTVLWAAITWGTLRSALSYRIAANTPTAHIRSSPQGYVELKGEFVPLDPDNPVTAPFSGKECIWYRASMEEYVRYSEGKQWQEFFAEADPRPGLLSDGTGHCLVVIGQAWRINLVEESWTPGDDAPEPISHFDPDSHPRRVRFVEKRIDAGPAYAVGDFVTVDAAEADANTEGIVKSLREWRTDYMAEVNGRPDENKPNSVGFDTSQRESIAQAIGQWVRELGVLEENRVNVLGPTGDNKRPFMLGPGDEGSARKEMRRVWIWGGGISVLGGAGLVTWLLYALGFGG